MTGPAPRMVCSGCGAAVTGEASVFRCPNADAKDDTDHVLRRPLPDGVRLHLDGESNPFVRYRELLFPYQFARFRGLGDADYRSLVADLDAAIAEVDGAGFAETPLSEHRELASQVGLDDGELWIKDETGNVSGSHKARHLMGIAIHLRIQDHLRPRREPRRLAVASCGNAALAAATVACAAAESLEVFVPPDAEPGVLARLSELNAAVTICARDSDQPGDPCYRRFLDAVRCGALPFGCQGSDNGLTIDGGRTLGYEIAAATTDASAPDAVIVQVGGGALASACFQALQEAHALGALPTLPRLYAVQTEGAASLARAYERVASRLATRLGIHAGDPGERAIRIAESRASEGLAEELRFAATHRTQFMWPWETEPKSFARGILDDETYDWLAVVEGMLRTGGHPVVASESELQRAHRLAHEHTAIPVCPTGSAGLAGVPSLLASGGLRAHERVAVLFTGRER